MNYIILDMEWNQPLCKERALLKPVYLRGEIVQIGAIKLNEKFQLMDSFKLSVRPAYYKKMHKRVQQLTKITDLDLAYGIPFPQAMEGFQHWCGEEFAFLTWGYDDIPMLRDNMLLHGMDINWIPKHYNLQNIFDAQITNEKKQFSLAYALERFQEHTLDAHDAFNDALCTYFVCRHLDMERGLREYTACVPGAPGKPRIKKKPAEPTVTYRSKAAALRDRALISFPCPVCGEIVFCREWFSQNDSKKVALGKCSNGKEYFVRLKFFRQKNGRYSANRMIYAMDDYHRAYFRTIAETKPRYPAAKSAKRCKEKNAASAR